MTKVKQSVFSHTFYVVILLLVALTTLFASPYNENINYNLDENKLCVTKLLTVSSFLSGNSSYTSIVNGKITNISNQKLYNIILTFYITTDDADFNTTTSLSIASLDAGEEYDINKSFSTSKDFEKIIRLNAKIGYGSYFTVKSEYLLKNYSFGIITFLITFVLMTYLSNLQKKQIEKFELEELQKQREKLQKQEQEELERLKKEEQNSELEKQIKLKELTIEELRLQRQLENEKFELISCSFCGTLNNKSEKNCTSCGAKLTKK